MAPDLNSVPNSPRPQPVEPVLSTSTSTSRRPSQSIAPLLPPATSTMSNILPSNQSAIEGSTQSPPSMVSHGIPTIGDNQGVGVGPGPLRHPRPMTASDIYLELEKEQEAVVNRLTRELSILRAAQNASVVSNASSTSTGLPDVSDQNNNHLLSGASHPAPSLRHGHQRTSSSNSIRSNSNTIHSASNVTSAMAPTSTAERIPRQNMSRTNSNTANLSRQNSMTSSRRSGASSPAPPTGSYQGADHFPSFYQQRPSPHPRELSHSNFSNTSAPRDAPEPSPGLVPATTIPSARVEDVAFHRQELEAAKRENEMLRRRIRELERTVRERRQSDASRTRSESVSTTASGVGRVREGGVGKAEDEVRVGESARGGGLR